MKGKSVVSKITENNCHHDILRGDFGLTLGGGGARGLAHIGIIKYLEENGLEAKEVSGTSVGAFIAALYAFGKTSDEMTKICSKINCLKLIDINFKRGILAGNKIKNFFKVIFLDTKIEDLKIPLKIVSTNINTGEKHIFNSGRIVDALRSSIGIPGAIMPNLIGDEELVDGGIINILPIEVLDSHNVLAISVLGDTAKPIENKRKLMGFEFDHSIFGMSYQILQKAIDIMMKQNELKSLKCDKNILYLHPEFPGIDYYEFHKFEDIIKRGYDEINQKVGYRNTSKNSFK